MPFFDYTASDRSGSLSSGTLQAKDKVEASKILATQGFFVLEVKPATNHSPAEPILENNSPPTPERASAMRPEAPLAKNAQAKGKKPPRSRNWWPQQTWSVLQSALYLRQLSVMFDAGIPIHHAANLLSEGEEYRGAVRARLQEIPRDLERGRLLSKSLQRSKLFSKLIVASVRLGEESGRLDTVLQDVADSQEQSVKLKRNLISRITYPVVVLVIMSVGLVVLGHVMSRVMLSLPGFEPQDIPLLGIVSSLFQSSAFLPLCFALLAGLGFLLHKIWHTPSWRLMVEQFVMAVPVVGNLVKRWEANTVTSHLSLLLKAGLPLDRGLQLCADLVSTLSYRRALLISEQQLRAGAELGECFYMSGLFPDDVLALLTAGEMSGKLEDSLARGARYCSEQVERTLETALALLEPLLIAILGLAIGSVLLCTFIPVFNSLQIL